MPAVTADKTFSNAGSAVNASSGGSSTGGDQTQSSYPDPNNIPDYGNIYGTESQNALTAWNTAKANIAAKRSSIFNQYGFNQDGTVDGNNQLGLYQQDRRGDALELQGAENAAMDRGLGLTGLGAQVADAPRYGEDVSAANLIGAYQGGLHQTDLDSQQSESDYRNALVKARQDEIDNAVKMGWMPAGADSTGTDTPPSANAKSTAKRLAAAKPVNFNHAAPTNRSGPLGIGNPAPKKATTSTYKGRH